MSTSKLERDYHCWNDCDMGGCPGHTATLEFQSTSDWLGFDDGKGGKLSGNPVEFEMLLSMLKELSGWRVEISSLLRDGLKEIDDAAKELLVVEEETNE